jgi:uncharacterized protein
VLILLPPSEGKSHPRRGRPVDLQSLSHPSLTEHRRRVMDVLAEISRGAPAEASRVLGLGPTQTGEMIVNSRLDSAPAAPAKRVFTGVLYGNLGLPDLPAQAARRAARWVLVFSALFGVLRANDVIPAYRLAGDVTLPGLGRVAASWRPVLTGVVEADVGHGLVLDMRSGPYLPMWRAPEAMRSQTLAVRVVRDSDGRRAAVTHANKVTKGLLARSLLVSGASPRTPGSLVEHLRSCGWSVDIPTAGVLEVLERS